MISKLSAKISLWFPMLTLDSTSCLLLLCLEVGVSKWATCWSGMKAPSSIIFLEDCFLLLRAKVTSSSTTICWSSSVGWDIFLNVTFLGTSVDFLMSFPFCVRTYSVWNFFTYLFLGVSPFLGVYPFRRVPLMTSIWFSSVE